MGIAKILEETIGTALEASLLATVTAYSKDIGIFIALGMAFVMMKQCMDIAKGKTDDLFTDLMESSVRQFLVLMLATSVGVYMDWIVGGVKALDAFLVAGGGGGSETVGDVIDKAADPIFEIGRVLILRAMDNPLSAMLPLPDPVPALLGLVVMVTYALFVCIASGVYLIQFTGQYLWLGLGPIGIACFAHPVTRQYGQNWVNTLLTFSVAKALIAAIGGVIANIVTQIAKDIGSGIESIELLGATISLLVAVVGLMIVMLNYNTLAGGLTSGAAISGIGREIWRAALGAARSAGPKPSSNQPSKPPGGTISNNNGNNTIARK